MLAGCTPEPAPTPTPTAAFTSEEEAFAAAEEVYRAYVSASNNVHLDDPSTFEPLFALSSGDFETSDRETLSELHAENYTLVGTVAISRFKGVESAPPFDTVVALVCVDVSASDIIDGSGHSVVPTDRPDMNPLHVTFVASNGDFLIDHADREEEAECTSN